VHGFGRQVNFDAGILRFTQDNKNGGLNAALEWLRRANAAFGHGMPCPY
jgi:hypothetical protein